MSDPGMRWRQVEHICDAALPLAGEERERFLARACGSDRQLRREVDAFLAHDRSAEGFLGSPVGALAAAVLREPGPALIGRRIGAYEIIALLGSGGMGEVYEARDTRLDRIVAIKVLAARLADDPPLRERFDREARAISALDHPHICALYDVGVQEGTSYLVMQYLEGQTLEVRLRKGALSVDQAVTFAIQIADALDAAHRKGIVHRDLKPGNVMLTKDGAKLLDFGLAKAIGPNIFGGPLPNDEAAAEAPPGLASLTARGVIHGTLQYMAPEQLEGLRADARSDLFALGAILYETVTGKKAFEGDSQAAVISSIMSSHPPSIGNLQSSEQPALDHVIKNCLAKRPDDRWQNARDLRLELMWIADAGGLAAATVHQPLRPRRRARAAWAVAVLAFVAAATIALAAGLGLRRERPERELVRFDVRIPSGDPTSFALSPDGRQLAFVANVDNVRRLWVRRLDQVAAQPLSGTDGAFYPFWAPDGTAVGFFAESKLKRINVAGGPAQVLADAPRATGGAWNREGVILFAPTFRSPIMRIPATGGTAVAVTRLADNASSGHQFPRFLPDGRRFLFTVRGAQTAANRRGVFVGSLDGREPFRVLGDERIPPNETANDFVADYGAPGALLIVRRGDLVAFPFDPVRAVVTGDLSPVVTGIGTDGAFAVSETGVLAHRSGTQPRQLVWFDRLGRAQRAVGQVDDTLENPELAPDGRRVAVDRVVQGNKDIYIIDLSLGVPKRFTFDAAADSVPVWSPDGQRLVFTSSRNELVLDIFEKPTSGSADERPLLVTAAGGKIPVSWSPDGRFLLYAAFNLTTGVDDLWALPMVGERKPFPVLQAPFQIGLGQFSPDGRWLAYESTESGPVAVYVRPFPGPGGQWQVSTAGGGQPRWRPDGKELFYMAADGRLMAVSIGVGADRETLEPGVPTPLFPARLANGGNVRYVQRGTSVKPQYAVAPDGRFLMNVSVDSATPITVVLNWSRELVHR